MAYNKQNYIRISEKFRSKYRIAETKADERRAEIHKLFPEIARIDKRMSGLSSEIMAAVMSCGAESVGDAISRIKQANESMSNERKQLLRAAGYPEDYTDPHYECEKCGDTGYIGTSICDCMKKELICAGYESAGIAGLTDKCSFDNFSLDYYRTSPEHLARMTAVFDHVKKYAETFTLGSGNMLLVGGTGLGKTHLSIAMAKTVIERGYDVVYTPATAMLSDFEFQRFGNSTSGTVAEDTSRYFNCELLIIDDLGTEINNQFTTNCLYNIINARLNSGLPTVISTNLVSNELRNRYWDRITSRIFGEYKIMAFLGKDIRMQKMSGNK